MRQITTQFEMIVTDLADGKNVVDVQTLEQGPHREVHVNETPSEIQTTRETGNDLETRLTMT